MSDEKTPFPQFSQEALDEADANFGILTLMYGVNPIGDPVWYYLSIQPSKFEAFNHLDPSEPFDIEDYGEIIASGIGEEPPPDIQHDMASFYGANHEFEEQLQLLAAEVAYRERLQTKFSSSKTRSEEVSNQLESTKNASKASSEEDSDRKRLEAKFLRSKDRSEQINERLQSARQKHNSDS